MVDDGGSTREELVRPTQLLVVEGTEVVGPSRPSTVSTTPTSRR